MLLNLRQIEVFRALMIAKTVSGAAELLHVSQPGISRILKYCEQKLDLQLFERRQGGLLPTPEAEELYLEVKPIYARLRDLDGTINRIAQGSDLVSNVGCPPSLAASLLPILLSKAKEHLPNTVVVVDALSNEDLADYIVRRRGALALSLYDPVHPLVIAEPTLEAKFCCIVPCGHQLADTARAQMRDVFNFNMVTYQPDTFMGRLLIRQQRQLEVEPTTSVQVRYIDDACAMVDQGMGIAVVLDVAVMRNCFPDLVMVPLATDSLRIYLLRHSGVPFSKGNRKLYNRMKAELSELDEGKESVAAC